MRSFHKFNMATDRCLKWAINSLLLSYVENITDEDEFVLLYELNNSKEMYPFWKYDKFDLENMDEAQRKREFPFLRSHIYDSKNFLNVPEKIVTCQRTVSSGVDALCILLKRLAFPCRYTDMVPTFGRSDTEFCLIYNHMLDYIYTQHHHRFQSWNQHFLQPAILQEYANVIREEGAPLENCFGFIDGTVIEICRPKPIYQRIVYNDHKRVHSIKFESLALPNGLFGNLSGSYEGRRHDSTMLHESRLLNDLRRFSWYNNQPLCIYGQPAYQLSVHLQARYRQAQNHQDTINYNKAMGEVRVTVEWLFGNIKNYFKFIDFKKETKLSLSPVGKVYAVCALFQNARTCLYGNQVSTFFGMEPISLQEYFS